MRTLLLGVRLAQRGSRLRVVVTGLALAFAVAFLLAVLGALPARQAKLDRLAERQPVSVGTIAAAGRRPVSPVLRLSDFFSTWRGHAVTGYQVINAQEGVLLPPGVGRLPRPGELVVSPDLARALRGRHAAELASRLPGRVVGQIAPAGLSGPRELLAYVGVARATSLNPGREVLRFGYRDPHTKVPAELRIAARLGALGLLLPVLVLVATATRLSAVARDRRLAAVRLVGGTPRQVALLVAGEALVTGVLGSALGLLVFWLLRPVAAALVPVEGGVFASDLQPPPGQLVGILLLVPLLSLLVSLLSMRRLVVDPLGVRRRSRRRSRAGWWRLVPLTLGLALLGLLWARHRDLSGPAVPLLLGGGALTLLGLAVVAPAVSRLAGGALVRLPGTATRLAGRRLLADPSATARTLTGTVLVVFVGTWLLAFLPILKVSNGSQARTLSRLLPSSTLVVGWGSVWSPPADTVLHDVPGVRKVVRIGSLQLVRPGAPPVEQSTRPEDFPVQVTVLSCRDLAWLVHKPLQCRGPEVLRVHYATGWSAGPEPVGTRALLGGDGSPVTGERLTLPAGRPVADLGVDPSELLPGDTVVDPALLPKPFAASLSGTLIVTTDGDPATTERVRNVLFSTGLWGAQTLGEQLAQEERTVRGYERAARLGLVLAVLIGSVGLLIASIDAVRVRRRGLAALAALGVPLGVLRRALLLEVLAPLLGCVGLALASGAFAAAAYLSADTYYRGLVSLPWAAWGSVGALALGIVLAVTSATLPLARGAARPEHLRTE